MVDVGHFWAVCWHFKLLNHGHIAILRPRYIVKVLWSWPKHEEGVQEETRLLGSLGKPLSKSLHSFNNWSQFWHPSQIGIFPFFFFFGNSTKSVAETSETSRHCQTNVILLNSTMEWVPAFSLFVTIFFLSIFYHWRLQFDQNYIAYFFASFFTCQNTHLKS